MSSDERILAVFLSYRGSLLQWQRKGILSREIAIYLLHLQNGSFDKVIFFSYDAGDEAVVRKHAIADRRFHSIRILSPPANWLGNPMLWSLIGPIIHRRNLANSSLLKTNQASGSWSAIIAKLITHRPLLFRMGYSLSRRFHKNGHVFQSYAARIIEWFGFLLAKHILVNNDQMMERAHALGCGEKTSLIPSYVDINKFTAKQDYQFTEPVVTVGRLSPQKNLANLIRACAINQMQLVIYGIGPLEAELKELALAAKANVTFAGSMPNEQLAKKLKDHSIFVLPSLHEGLPKALIEAMAAGLVCAGSNIPGITDIIRDGINGHLINGFDAEDIAATLRKIQEQRDPQPGRTGRRTIEQFFDLETYAAGEAKIFRQLQ